VSDKEVTQTTISGISPTSGSGTDPASVQNIRTRVQQDFAQIAQSLQSNDLAGAQQAYSDLVQLTPASQSANQTGTAGNPVPSDLASLGSALQSGNTATAQTAFSKLETDLSHNHHHRHGSSAPGASTPPASTDTTNPGTGSSPTSAGGLFGALVKTGLKLFA
jgi:hypothetical protein